MRKLFLFCAAIALLAVCGTAYSATIWYMPEGSTSINSQTGESWDLWILITNPNSEAVHCRLTFYKQDATTTECDSIVSANSRSSIKVSQVSGMTNQGGISTKVECVEGNYNGTNYKRLPIYAERAMYVLNAAGTEWKFGHSARAVSGVEGCYTEIGQPSTFPIIISQPGSYKLTGSLTVPANTNGIEITATFVTLDLNGFAIIGPGFGSTEGAGVYISSESYYVNVINGTIVNFSDYGINAFGGGHYFGNLKVCENGMYGVYLSNVSNAIVEKCQVNNNSTVGIHLSGATYNIIRDNECSENNIAIYLGATSLYNRIERNNCAGVGTNDISCSVSSSKNLIIENTYKNAVSISAGNVVNITNQGNIDLN